MVKWKFFSKSKTKEDAFINQENISEEAIELEHEPGTEDKPLDEYTEILHTSSTKRSSIPPQITWRNIDAIEKEVDTLHTTKTRISIPEVDKTVDRLINQRKKK